ncbi:CAP domain-containing protein [Deinococcus sonorensis]|uniref:CAP domain-containing protein n=2 Tax=Deinococcus sonorensis TaxID=309891 RepID=A0AAU7UDE1_9DEIO
MLFGLSLGGAVGPQIQLLSAADHRAPLDVQLSADVPAGSAVSWEFGDGQQGSGSRITHTYYRPGQYELTVQLRLPDGRVSQARAQVTVESGGPEQAVLTVLQGSDSLALSAGSSRVYLPYTPQYTLDGRPVTGRRQTLTPGLHTASLLIKGSDGPLLRTVRFQSGPVPGNLAFDQEVVRLTNRARAQGWDCTRQAPGGPALSALALNDRLSEAARAQSVGMALGRYFAHVSAVDGSDPFQRIDATGYRGRAEAENIAAGQTTPQQVVDAWLRSPGHCHNIMGDYTEIGVAYAALQGSVYGQYWTQTFGRP